MTKDALYAGVTTIALWQDSGKESILSGGWGNFASAKLIHVQAEGMRADPLRRVMEWAGKQGSALGCEIYSTGKLKQVLELRKEIGCQIILVHLSDCLGMEDEIVVSGCQVITGACCLRGKNNAYEMAVRLQNRGVRVAITADYPASRLHYLPLTAGLCRRAGMTLENALRTVTLDAAKVLGIEAQCGSIEPGKRADLVIYDGEPLKFATGKIAVFSSGEMV